MILFIATVFILLFAPLWLRYIVAINYKRGGWWLLRHTDVIHSTAA